MDLGGDFLFCYYFLEWNSCDFQESVFVLGIFYLGMLLGEGKQIQELSVCLNVLSRDLP